MTAERHPGRTIAYYRWTPNTPHPTADARRILPAYNIPTDAVEDAALAASELVANATEHAPGPYALHLRRLGPELVVEVHDGDPALPPIPRHQPPPPHEPAPHHRGGGTTALLAALTERGRGLHLVHALTGGCVSARRTHSRRGKYVWFLVSH